MLTHIWLNTGRCGYIPLRQSFREANLHLCRTSSTLTESSAAARHHPQPEQKPFGQYEQEGASPKRGFAGLAIASSVDARLADTCSTPRCPGRTQQRPGRLLKRRRHRQDRSRTRRARPRCAAQRRRLRHERQQTLRDQDCRRPRQSRLRQVSLSRNSLHPRVRGGDRVPSLISRNAPALLCRVASRSRQ